MTQKSLFVPTASRPTQTPKRPLTDFEKAAAKVQDGNKADPGLWLGRNRLSVSEGPIRELKQGSWQKFGDEAPEVVRRFEKQAVDLAGALGDDTGARILRHSIRAELAELRRTGEKADDASRAKTLRDYAEESRRRLQQTYGADRAPDILNRVRKLVKSNAGVSRVLASHDLAEHPDVVDELAAWVYSRNYR